MAERESMEYDVVVVGAGPSGLATAIRLKQLCAERGTDLSVCVIEKGSEVGAHILSGAVIDPRALDELLPDWKTLDSPLTVPVTRNEHWVLSAGKKYRFPHVVMPPFMNNKGTYTLSLGNLCRWLAGQAEALGVEIFPGFAAAEVLFNQDGSVRGVATGDMGVARDGTHRADYQPGMELHGRYTFFAEGATYGDIDRDGEHDEVDCGTSQHIADRQCGHTAKRCRRRDGELVRVPAGGPPVAASSGAHPVISLPIGGRRRTGAGGGWVVGQVVRKAPTSKIFSNQRSDRPCGGKVR